MSESPPPEVDALTVDNALTHLERCIRYQLEQALGICFTQDRFTGTFQPDRAATRFLSRTRVPGELSQLDGVLQPSLNPAHPNRAHDDMIHLRRYIMHRASRASIQGLRDRGLWRQNESIIHLLMGWNNTDVRNWCQLIRQRANGRQQAR